MNSMHQQTPNEFFLHTAIPHTQTPMRVASKLKISNPQTFWGEDMTKNKGLKIYHTIKGKK